MATINDILTYVDEVKPNQYDDSIKVGWIENLDRKIFADVIANHYRDDDFEPPTEYDYSTELYASDVVYRNYVMAQIDYHNNETERYANTMTMFNSEYTQWAQQYNRMHRPFVSVLDL